MLAVSFLGGLGMLLWGQGTPFGQAVAAAFLASGVGTAVELFSPSEYDTVTVPAAVLAVLLLMGL